MTGVEVRGMWIQPATPVRDARVTWTADPGLFGADEARALAFALAGALGTVLGCWLAGMVG